MPPDQNTKEHIHVEAYAGASYPERPTAVWRQGQRLDVTQVLRSWRTPDGLHFLVEITEIGRVELIYHYQDGWWLKDRKARSKSGRDNQPLIFHH